ncbi:peptidoglycan DD-metalloendopeptidase family protein, partial [Rhizocola hellebori]|uniref:peptidoglycan DD-metalloendopeptidase family protein n=1 Tax=Rhizocola hellebori TaxID=1392758 RepID=UPI0019454699
MRVPALRQLASLCVAILAGVAVSVVHVTAAAATTPRPAFQLPFLCGEAWRLTTYDGHDDYDIDFFAVSGPTPGRAVIASAAGTVAWAGWDGKDINGVPYPPGTVGTQRGLGYGVIINHGGGWFTAYGHFNAMPLVNTNQVVPLGQPLGFVGKTGATRIEHLHYEQLDDTLDPAKTRGVRDKVESVFNGVYSHITTDGSASTGPIYVDDTTSPSQERVSANCGGAPIPAPPAPVVSVPSQVFGDSMTVTATVNGYATRVSFLLDGIPIGEATSTPFTLGVDLRNVSFDIHSISAIAVASYGTGETPQSPMSALTPFTRYRSQTDPGASAQVDFNGDGRTDIAVAGVGGWNSIPLALAGNDLSFATSTPLVGAFADYAANPMVKMVPGDFNGDGRTDIALTGVVGWNSIP